MTNLILDYVNSTIGKDTTLTIAEIGVLRGEGSVIILNNMKVNKLYLIDPYKDYTDGVTFDINQDNLNRFKQIAIDNVKPFESKVEFIYKPSFQSSKDLSSISFDMVYIDGNHLSEYVISDLYTWLPLVKDNGILCGHDWSSGTVQSAVSLFRDRELPLHPSWTFQNNNEDWLIHKLTP